MHLLADGNRFKKWPDIPHTTLVKGGGQLELGFGPFWISSYWGSCIFSNSVIRLFSDASICEWM